MVKVRSHWHCDTCLLTPDPPTGIMPSTVQIRVLNLYAGIGGNRKLWPANCHITAVEYNPKIAAAYKKLYPNDTVIISDAHKYLLKNHHLFDIIWSSPPCQSHTRMNYMFTNDKKRFPDLSLYQEIIFLKAFCKGLFVIENVKAYYTPLILPDKIIDRHVFWSNFQIDYFHVKPLPDFIKLDTPEGKLKIMEWLDIFYDKKLCTPKDRIIYI